MQLNSVQNIQQKIESVWVRSDLDPAFIKALRQALPFFNSTEDSYQNFIDLMYLPNLCCQAAGGQPFWADEITAAWLLFYIGAHIMDSIEDLDMPDEWWDLQGPGVALNVASAFFFSASTLLNEYYQHERTYRITNPVIADFNIGFLRMCQGQHFDLVTKRPTLQQYWEMVGAKSGTFFSIASRSGASLATRDNSRIESFSKFGYHLGILIQILDDLEDLDANNLIGLLSNRAQVYSTLPFVYAMEVSAQDERKQINSYLDSESFDVQLASELIRFLDELGTGIYIHAEIQKHREKALEALNNANPAPPAKDLLITKLAELGKI